MDNMKIPKHIAIMMDGNGRWAKKKFMPRTFGHIQGGKTLERICKTANDLGVEYLTVYAFSTENWKRSKDEVEELFDKYVDTAYKYVTKWINVNILDTKSRTFYAIFFDNSSHC